MKVKDIMTRNVASVKPDASITEAAQLMQKYNIGSVPVCDDKGLVGIVTDRDIVVRNVASGTDPRSARVMDVMTSAVSYASPEMDITEVTDIMSQKQIRRMPVVENNKLVGILALGDLAVDRRFDTEASEALSEISKNNYRH